MYKNLSGYFKERYGRRLKKICIDAGFSCPNRDGTCGFGGCIYCGERGAGEHIKSGDITEQVKRALSDASDDELFVAYFQNFTNTYADPKILKERYDAALIDDRIKVLAIGTRPDCIDEEKAALIASYKDRCDVWVELGLQTANDETARLINRGYPKATFDNAMRILDKYGIDVVVHIIIGLPGEDTTDIMNTVDYLNGYKLFGIKLHSIYVMSGTVLADMYKRGEYSPPSKEEYISTAVLALQRIKPEVVIHRVTGDCPDGMLVAPEWNKDKNEIIREIQRKL